MHEMSIAQGLIDILREEMRRHRATRLRRVRLRLGELSAVVPEALSFCFSVITEGTEMEGAELVMDQVPLEGRCKACGETFRVLNYTFQCPKCDGQSVEVLGGRDLSVVEMEVD